MTSKKEEASRSSRKRINHRVASFRECWDRLPEAIKAAARRAFRVWSEKPDHSALDHHALKGKSKGHYSVKVYGKQYLAVYWLKSESEVDVCLWHWIGTHADFDVKFPE